jgi:acyl-coenzyme A thioesterase PaaI-like protein
MATSPQAMVRMLGFKIPLVMFLGPRVVRLDEAGCTLRIPLRWRSRNHVGSMYVGAICAGAELAAGLPAARLIFGAHPKVVLVFAGIQGDFLKRADGDVHFTCTQGPEIAEAVRRADASGERVTLPVHVTCTVPSKYGDEPVARFTLGLSMKKKG